MLDEWAKAAAARFGPTAHPADLAVFLSDMVREEADRTADLHRAFADLSARHARALDEEERRAHILDFSRHLGRTAWQVRGDRRAFRRWFGFDAVIDRYRRRVSLHERRIAFALDRLGAMAALALGEAGEEEAQRRLWRRLNVEGVAARLMSHDGDARVRTAAFHALAAALRAVAPALQEGIVGDLTLRTIYRAALTPATGPSSDVWSQREALRLLRTLSPDAFRHALRVRLSEPAEGDDLWVRRGAVALLCESLEAIPDLADLAGVVRNDPSVAVRQALALGLWRAPKGLIAALLTGLATEDPAPEVRAAVLTTAPHLLDRVGAELLRPVWSEVFATEKSPFVLRTALTVAGRLPERMEDGAARRWFAELLPDLERLHTDAPALTVRRWAAETRERLWCRTDPAARRLSEALALTLRGIPEGRKRTLWRLRREVAANPELAARVLAVLAQDDHGYDLTRGPVAPRVQRGARFRFRAWRALHEMRHPSPDKRQAFRHTIGRVWTGTLSAPSAILSELAETKVPGEPLHLPEEAGWRPYLPLPDHALSAIDTGAPVRLFTAEGVTEVVPPKSFLRRLKAKAALTRRFPVYANLRNWTSQRNLPPSAYLKALSELGFSFSLRPHRLPDGRDATLDESVQRFFPAVIPFVDPAAWRKLETYFFSVYQNTLQQLAVFIAAALLWFLGRHVWLAGRMRRTRAALPLVLGGWGTRGKSGTERLKAAMINALGYALISKTTGCEAMFLTGNAFGPVREMFLFRPYDKATIWEQFNVARIATTLGADVFLWECMGLTPSYVRVLQRHWMRDDISTITNTYPDHEDLQGPAGRNIPEVMTNFIPERGTLLTTEEQMRPILADAAHALGTRMVGVGWLEAGLLPSDALKRFPYEEHPFNIALVLALADELGVDRDFALKEMADRVVPDLGVLKAYPTATLRTRRLEFVNGMSANERFGALGNWTRMGFEGQDPDTEPGVFITTVVNNRADRVSRSRVFASILANDVAADRHVLIGSNLEGLQGYIEEAWQATASTLTLWPETGTGREPDPLETLEAAARRLRVPRGPEQVEAALRAMLEGQPGPLDVPALLALRDRPDALRAALEQAGVAEPAAILDHLAGWEAMAREYREFAAKVRAGGDRKALDADYAALLTGWFRRKIVVIEDYYATGDQVVERIAAETPPGFHNRIMGMQNIKGTGLDFVYRWQAWDAVFAACRQARSEEPAMRAEGLRALAAFQEHGVLGEEHVRATVESLRGSAARDDAVQAQLDLVLANLDRQMAAVRTRMAMTRTTGPLAKILDAVEAVLDSGDAVRRRRTAERVYRDMATERISHDRAAVELKKLYARQKGGWLGERLRHWGYRVRWSLAGMSLLKRRSPEAS